MIIILCAKHRMGYFIGFTSCAKHELLRVISSLCLHARQPCIIFKILYARHLFSISLPHAFSLFLLRVAYYKYRKQSSGGVLQMKVFLKILKNSQENTCGRVCLIEHLRRLLLKYLRLTL